MLMSQNRKPIFVPCNPQIDYKSSELIIERPYRNIKKFMLLCAGLIFAMVFVSCASSESAYKIAFENARSQKAAQKGKLGNGLSWNFSNDGVLTISGNGEMPDFFDGKVLDRPWKSISQKVNKIVVEEGITSIGKYAFWGTHVQYVDLPKSLRSIDSYAFSQSRQLVSIQLPEGLQSIGVNTFDDCKSLKSIVIPNSVRDIEWGAFMNCDSLSSIVLSNSITEIKDLCFSHNNCTSIVIPNSVTRIGRNAFSHCYKLEQVYIPNSVKSIDGMAFYCCKNLTSIDIPYSVTDIGEYAFSECENLKSVNISYPAISIGVNAFLGCWNLQFVTAPNSYRLRRYFLGEHVKFKELIASTDKKYYKCDGGIIDASDKWIIPQGTYNDIIHCADNYLIVKKGGKYGLITFDGKVIITPKYDNLGVAGSGYLKFKQNGSWGIMNYAGKTIIPSNRGYKSIEDFSTGQKTFAYTMNGYKGECNAQGRELSRVKVKVDTPSNPGSSLASKLKTESPKDEAYDFDFKVETHEGKRGHTCQMKAFVGSILKFSKLNYAELPPHYMRLQMTKINNDYFLIIYVLQESLKNFPTILQKTSGTITFSNKRTKKVNMSIKLSTGGDIFVPSILIKIGSASEMDDWEKSEIAKIEFDGKSVELGADLFTAETIKAMHNFLRNK